MNQSPMQRVLADGSIIDTVARHALATPDKPFLIIESEAGPLVTTFGQLRDRAGVYAALLSQNGLRDGDTVALLFTTHVAQAPVFLGAMMLGAVPFLLPTMTVKQDPALFWRAQLATLERAAVRLVVTDAATAAQLASHAPALADRVIDVDTLSLDDVAPLAAVTGGAVAFLQHSSGTTGAKKGIVLTHRMVLDFVAALGTALDVTEADIIASWLPLYHDMGLVGCLMLPMLLGITTVHTSPFDWVVRPVSLFEMIERHKATMCWQPNFAFQHLSRTAPRGKSWDLSSMRAFIDCSESCKADTIRAFAARFADCGLRPAAMQVSYGMAENVFIATQTAMNKGPRFIAADLAAFDTGAIAPPVEGLPSIEVVSCGFPISQTRIEIRDEDGTALPDRRIGQIWVTSPYMFDGYHKSDLALTKLKDGWYATGDFGFFDAGEVFVCGRRDELLIINGRNIFAPDIEFSINQATAVKPGRCVAVGPYNPRTGSQSLVVVAEMEAPEAEARRDLARSIQALILAEFGIATHDVWVTDIGWVAKTTSGKIARGANESRYMKERWGQA